MGEWSSFIKITTTNIQNQTDQNIYFRLNDKESGEKTDETPHDYAFYGNHERLDSLHIKTMHFGIIF